jgi:hypothetical protein
VSDLKRAPAKEIVRTLRHLFVLGHLEEVLTLGADLGRESLCHQSLQIGRQLLPGVHVEAHVEAGPDVVSQAAVLLHLVQLCRVDKDERVLLPVHNSYRTQASRTVDCDAAI